MLTRFLFTNTICLLLLSSCALHAQNTLSFGAYNINVITPSSLIGEDYMLHKVPRHIIQEKDSLDMWKEIGFSTSIKNAKGCFTEISLNNSEDNSYWYRFIYDYTYNSDGKVTRWEKKLNTLRGTSLHERHDIEYIENRINKINVYSFDSSTMKYVPQYIKHFIYNSEGQLVKDSSVKGSSPYTFTYYYYDINGNLTEKTEINANGDSIVKELHVYGVNNKEVKRTSYYSTNGVLKLFSEYAFEYDINENLIELSVSYLDFQANGLKLNIKHTHYLGANQQVSAIVEKQMHSNGMWRNRDSTVIHYQSNGNWDFGERYFSKELDGFSWGSQPSIRFIFNAPPLSVNTKLNTSDFTFYPNPVNSILYVETESTNQTSQLSVINMLGKEVLRKSIIDYKNGFKTQINIEHLPTGVYWLKIGSTTKKLIKQ